MATEDFQKAVADDIATNCTEKVKNLNSTDDQSPEGCTTIALKALHCASKGMINAWPSDKQSTEEHCVKFREFMKSDFKGRVPRPTHSTTTTTSRTR